MIVDDANATRAADAAEHGFSVERRAMLWIPLAAMAGAVIRGAPILAEDRATALATAKETHALSPLTLEQFGEKWDELATALRLGSTECDESYAGQLAGAIARVPIESLPKLEEGRTRGGVVAGPSWFIAGCLTVEYQMQPDAVVPYHNHTPQVIVTMCAEGEVHFAQYEIEGEAPPCTQIDGKEFRVRESRSGFLTRNRSTSLTRLRDGIHGFTAGKHGARIIDFTISLSDDIETFSYLDRSPEPIDPERRVFAAVWTGKDRK